MNVYKKGHPSEMLSKFISKVCWQLVAPVVVLTAVIDQGTKYLALSNIAFGGTIPVFDGFFDLTLAFNKGAAFGFLASVPDGTRQILLSLATVIALGAVLFFLIHDQYEDRVAQLGLALIIGGAVGNVIDRVRLGYVVDFLDIYYHEYHWPAFNIADSAICVGVALLILRTPRGSKINPDGAN